MRRRQQGIALIEAMVSLLILSLGALGFIGMHLQLRANADVARQRGEAVRIAQQDMERLRLFRSLDSLASTTLYWGGADETKWDASFRTASGTSTGGTITDGGGNTLYAVNTTYTITRGVTTSNTADYKELQVKVAWSDRQGKSQSIALRSVIDNTDPSVAVSLGIAPNGSPVKDLLGRNVQVPIPAKNLGNGTSVFKPTSSATVAYVFDNNTGEVIKTCTVASTTYTAQLDTASLNSCADTKAYLLSGFIRFKSGKVDKNLDPGTVNDAQPNGTLWGVQLSLDNTAPPASSQGTLRQLTSSYWVSKTHTGYNAPSCAAEYSKTISYQGVTATGSSIFYLTVPASLALTAAAVAPYDGVRAAGSISNLRDTNERYVAYSCIVYPTDLDSNAATKMAWTGRPLLTESGATIAAGSSYKVCRLSSDYNQNGYLWKPALAPASNPSADVTLIDNEEHPYAYLNVSKALSNQNYLVIEGKQNCPKTQTDSGGTGDAIEIDGKGQDNYTDATTVLHQP